MTGGAAPKEQRGTLKQGPIDLGNGFRLHRLDAAIRLVGDFWQPGDPDAGIEVTSQGRVLPRIDHIAYDLPTTGIQGEGLGMSDQDLERARRDWYARLFRTGPRLTPVHHILGPSAKEWRGVLHSVHVAARDDWRAKLWTVESLQKLQATHEGLYLLDWQILPMDRILSRVRRRLEKARKEGAHDVKELQACFERARRELEAIKLMAAGDVGGESALRQAADRYDSAIKALRR
jgi:hypothetical protein